MTVYIPGIFRALCKGYGSNLLRTFVSAIAWTTSTTWIPRLTLSIPSGLNGVYKVSWQGIVKTTSTSTEVEARLYDASTATAFDLQHHDFSNTAEARLVAGEYSVTMTGASKVFWIQYRRASGVGSVGLSHSTIEFKRIA